MVVLNRIYTRTGDDGTTALGSGERRPKYDLRIAAYGTVDETNAAIGVVRLHLADAPELDRMMGLIQNDLFDLGADLAVPQRDGKAERLRVVASQVERIERDIDRLNERLAPLTSFILPGGTPAAAYLHLSPAPYVAGRNVSWWNSPPIRPSRSATPPYSMSTACRISCSWPAAPSTTTAPETCFGCPARIVKIPPAVPVLRGRFLAFAR